jgi:hypothetical protein
LPEALRGRRFYAPGELGFEKEVRKRLEYFARVRERLRAGNGPAAEADPAPGQGTQ